MCCILGAAECASVMRVLPRAHLALVAHHTGFCLHARTQHTRSNGSQLDYHPVPCNRMKLLHLLDCCKLQRSYCMLDMTHDVIQLRLKSVSTPVSSMLASHTGSQSADIPSCMQYMSRVDEIILRASHTAVPGDCRGMFAVVPQNIYGL